MEQEELLRILRSLNSPRHLQIHAQLHARGLASSPRLLQALVFAALSISAAPSSSSPRHAGAAIVAHNTLIDRLAGRSGRGCFPEGALGAYGAMRDAGVDPNGYTFTFLLRACEALRRLPPCGCVHGQIVRCGFGSDVAVQNALLNVYYKCGDPGDVGAARKVFDGMPERDVVSWNSMLGVYMASNNAVAGIELFEVMPERNVVSWNTVVAGFTRIGATVSARFVFDRIPIKDDYSWNLMISGYATNGYVEAARSLFDKMDFKDVVSWTTMVSAYVKIGDIDSAKVLFDQMPVKNLVSWNAMIAAYNHKSRYGEAVRTFQQMMIEGGFMPDEATLVSVASACTQLRSSEYCSWLNSYISKSNTHTTVALGNALIDMFAKCGQVGRARSIFRKMKTRSNITWTTMISGFAYNGRFRDALLIYKEMCGQGVEPDDAVFIAALAACARGGLLRRGRRIFKQMVEHYGIVPRMEHYRCMVDLFGRTGKLQEAVRFIEKMPLKPGAVIWVTLLSSCIAHGDAELIEYVSAKIVEIEPFNPGFQVLISNCSALKERWGSVMDAHKTTRDWTVEKTPSGSLIQIGSEVH
ncbi:unnamed protein product [Urochloa decumbens]|uniref:Pentatricopeptide repeat-containing protein n=1 Tax=Urochloa decumbens TaxID=240449 RepID=A0ABC9FIR9_9POAL